MALVAGIDSSTQSCKVLIVDPATGEVVRQGRAHHPSTVSRKACCTPAPDAPVRYVLLQRA